MTDPSEEPAAPAGPRHRSGTGSSPVLGVMESSGNAGSAMPDLPPEWRTQGSTNAAPASAEAGAGGDQDSPSTWFAPRRRSQGGAEPTPAPAPAPDAPPAAAPQRAAFEPPVYETPAYEPPAYEQPPARQQAEPQGFDPSRRQSPYEPQPPGFGAGQAFQPAQPAQTPQTSPQPPYGQQTPYQGSPYQQPYGRPGGKGAAEASTATPTAPTAPGGAGQQAPASGGSGRPPGMNGGLSVPPDTGSGNRRRPDAPSAAVDPDATAAMPLFRPGAAGPGQGVGPGAGQEAAAPGPPQQQKKAKKPAQGGKGKAAQPGNGGQTGRHQGEPPIPTPAPVSPGYAGGTGGVGAEPRKLSEETAAGVPAAAKPSAKPRSSVVRRGRKLVVTGIGLVVVVGGVAYGAGLALNQSDVPKGTTVLGQNIGGDTSDAAVHTLDSSLGTVASKPLQVTVGTKKLQLNPSVAGLTIDIASTVQQISHHSYNPVNVVKSLQGGTHPVTPVVKIDQDKLRSALQQLSVGSGSAKEGSVHFTSDGTVTVDAPHSGQGLNVTAAMALVQRAYENRAAGLPDGQVVLPLTEAQPKASAAALNAAAASIGDWAVKNTFTVTVGSVSQLFGKHTFSLALTLKPDATGKVVPVFDLTKLQDAYGDVFDGQQIKHNGTLGPVTSQDIATALTQLLSKPNGTQSITLS